MISNPNLVYYACIARGLTILVEYSSRDQQQEQRYGSIESLALRCVEKTPPNHSMFSHTIHNRTYMFLIDGPVAYFAIFDEKLDKSESLLFLNKAKSNFEELMAKGSILSFENVPSLGLQSHSSAIFGDMLDCDMESEENSMRSLSRNSQHSSVESSSNGKKTGVVPLLGKPINALKKKKRLYGEANGSTTRDITMEKKVDVFDGNGVLCRDFNLTMVHNKNGGGGGGHYLSGDRQKAKQVWRKHVWIVLTLDLLVCAIMFGIWLWICRGLQCIDG